MVYSTFIGLGLDTERRSRGTLSMLLRTWTFSFNDKVFSQQFLFSFIFLFPYSTECGLFMVFIKDGSFLWGSLSRAGQSHNRCTIRGPFCCSLEIGSCLFAQPKNWRHPASNESYRAGATGKVLISEIKQTKRSMLSVVFGDKRMRWILCCTPACGGRERCGFWSH